MSVSDDFKRAVGARLRLCRDGAGLRQSDVAIRLGIHPMRVSEWERGQAVPNTEQVAELAKLFDTSADDLLGITADNVATLQRTQDGADVQSGPEAA